MTKEEELQQQVDLLDYDNLQNLRYLAAAECKVEFYEEVLASINKLVAMLGESK